MQQLIESDKTQKQEAQILLERFNRVRKRTEQLCAPLTTEDYLPQPAVFVSPAKWHIAHTTWFFENFILEPNKADYRVFDTQFCYLFNSYYQQVGERLARDKRGTLTRPSVEEIWEYRGYVEEHVRELLGGKPAKEVLRLTELGLQHEEQHQELLITDLKYILAQNPIGPVYQKGFSLVNHVEAVKSPVYLEEGIYDIGYRGKEFCFDNELAAHRVFLEKVEIDSNLVRNGEFIEFIEAGGYDDPKFWLDDGWCYMGEQGLKQPLYWKKEAGVWMQFSLEGWINVNPEAVLTHINYYEAQAFALWKGKRLLTEFEWEAASGQFTWGSHWEWTLSAYLPYPGYEIPKGAVGEYNGKFMVNQMVLRGASKATAPGHSRNTYRNFF
ncbi:MAG: ergothioneine biosynthesis protein EgtB, partial [Luteibaculum sp.]